MLANLVADTIAQSSLLTRAEAEQALSAAQSIGRMLIAAGHLEQHPITLVAGNVYCEITTVSGKAALTFEENLNPMPGAASAASFTIYLPSPAPLQDQVEAAASAHTCLSDASPPAPQAAAASVGPLIDRAALQTGGDAAMTSTYTYAYSRTHTATHLTDVILGTISDILADLNVNMDRLYRDWVQNENAIKAWIEEGSLDTVVLECHQPSGTAAPVIEFPLSYTTAGDGNAEFTASRARVARFRAKVDRVPAGTTYRALLHLQGTPHRAARLGPRPAGQHRRPARHHVRQPRLSTARLSRHALPLLTHDEENTWDTSTMPSPT